MSLSDQVVHVGQGILVVRNFLAPQIADDILQAANEYDWIVARSGVYQDNTLVDEEKLTKSGVLSCPTLPLYEWEASLKRDDAKAIATQRLSIKISRLSKVAIARYPSGSLISEHQDTGPLNTTRLVTFVLYLNREYQGGEIVFPTFDITYAPQGGDLILFLSEYRHRVERVTKGERYCLVWFGEAAR